DLRVLAFTLVLSLLTGIAFGIAPAWQVATVDLAKSIKEGGRGATDGKRRSKIRSGLVIGQVAVGFVLLASAGLLLETLWHLERIDPGFNARNVLTFRISLPSLKYSATRQIDFYDRLIGRVRSIPGVRSASAVFPLPLTNNDIEVSFEIEGRTFPKGQNPVT